MRRRDFIKGIVGSATAWPLTTRAQQSARLSQVAILRAEIAGDPEGSRNSAALLQGLQALGWTQGRNLRIEQRWAGGSVDAMKALAKELVALEPNAIVVVSTPATVAVMQETHTIPIVFVQNFDPVESGLVKSLVAPGGNITGFTSYEPAVASKRLELLKGGRAPGGPRCDRIQPANGTLRRLVFAFDRDSWSRLCDPADRNADPRRRNN
jgi:putative ABC transport system substrate-binding protein